MPNNLIGGEEIRRTLVTQTESIHQIASVGVKAIVHIILFAPYRPHSNEERLLMPTFRKYANR